jgi:hypothetical protein
MRINQTKSTLTKQGSRARHRVTKVLRGGGRIVSKLVGWVINSLRNECWAKIETAIDEVSLSWTLDRDCT